MIGAADLDEHDLQLGWQAKVVEHGCRMNR